MWELLNPKGVPSQSPGLERRDYPGWMFVAVTTPTGLRLRFGVQVGRNIARSRETQPFQKTLRPVTQGSLADSATLGFEAKSLWYLSAKCPNSSGHYWSTGTWKVWQA